MAVSRFRTLGFAVIAILVLSACGGGGGSNNPPVANAPNPSPPSTPQPPAPPAATAPAITEQPQGQRISDGQSAAFSVTAAGTAPLIYQWKRNGADILGATFGTYSISAASLADDAAQFTVTVTNSAGSVTSGSAVLHVAPVAPAIGTQPAEQAVLAGSTATFSVVATGSQPLSYQWRRNGIAIPGANSSNYITAANTRGDSGALFDVTISNAAGNIASSAALLTVTEYTAPPSITRQPQSATAPVGAAIAFSVSASGTAPFQYQWKRNDAEIPNETGPTLIISPVSGIHHQDAYTVRVSNAAGSVASSTAVLSVRSQSGQIDLVAGLQGGEGNVDGTGGNAHFRRPRDVAVDPSGNLFVADFGNSTVRKITPDGVVTTIAGRPGESAHIDGESSQARFTAVHSIDLDDAGNIYVTDANTIRKVATNGTVTTLAGSPGELGGYADGSGSAARFNLTQYYNQGQLEVAQNGDIYVGDCGNHVIRRVTQMGVVSTYAGIAQQTGSVDGVLASATFNCPSAIAFDAAGSLYVADTHNNKVRKIASGAVTTLAAGLTAAADLVVDSGNNLFVVDNQTLHKITPAGVISTVAGSTLYSGGNDGIGTSASFSSPVGITIDSADNLYVADDFLNAIRKITPSFVVTTIPSRLGQSAYAGFVDGAAVDALFNVPVGITADAAGTLYVADSWNCSVRKIDASGFVTTLVGEPEEGLGACSSAPQISRPIGIAVDPAGTVFVDNYSDGSVHKITPSGENSILAAPQGSGSAPRWFRPTGVASDGNGNLYVADTYYHTISKVIISSGAVSTLAGDPQAGPGSADGAGSSARFNGPCGIEADSAGNVYVADCGNQTIRKVSPSGVVTTLAGKVGTSGYVDGDVSAALFDSPADVALDDNGNLYVVDQTNYLIRKLTPSGIVSTVAGIKGLKGQALGPLPTSLNMPTGIHARTLSGGRVELLVTMDHAVIRIIPD